MGVLILRVSVAAAPGTGVASGSSSVEQAALSAAARSVSTRTACLPQVIAQLLGSARMPQFAKRFGFDLPNPFPGDAELTTDFLQRTLASVVQTKSQGDNAALTLGKRPKHVMYRVAQQGLRRLLDRRDCFSVLNQVPKLAILIVANRRCQADRVTRGAAGLHDALGSTLQLIAPPRLQSP